MRQSSLDVFGCSQAFEPLWAHALFLERRQYMPSFKLTKLTARVIGAGEPDL
jgi:hypothetical protein